MKTPPRIVILGGGYAGILAAARLSLRAPSARVTLVSDRPTFVERIRLHQAATGQRIEPRPLSSMLAGAPVELVVGKVQGLDPGQQRVLLCADGVETSLPFDQAVVCLGSAGALDSVAGAPQHAFDVGDETAALALSRRLLDSEPGDRVVVCGGGLTGVEAASEIAERFPGLRVSLVSSGPVGEGLPAAGRAYLLGALSRLRVEVREGEHVEAIDDDAVLLRGGERLPSAATVWALGLAPSGVGREAGLAVSESGRILVDTSMRSTSHPHILAAGDCAEASPHGAPLAMACATAMPMAAQAADVLAAGLTGAPATPFRYGFTGRCISLGRRDGLVAGGNPDGSFSSLLVRGRTGAWIKEAICRYAGSSARWQARGLLDYRWVRPSPATRALPAPEAAGAR